MQHVLDRLRAINSRLGQYAWFRVARNSLQGLNDDDGPRMAAGLTYFALFAIFPFILVLISLLSLAVDSREAQARVVSLLSGFLPGGASDVEQLIQGVISARGAAAGFGVVALLWSALSWFESIDRSLNDVWSAQRSRSFIRGKLFALAMVSGMALVMLLAWLSNIALAIARGLSDALVPAWVVGYSAVWALVPSVVSFGLMSLLFLLLYRFSPMCQLSWGEVWRPALITAFLWEAVRSGFALYVANFANYSSLYGPLSAVMAFLLWLYLAHTIVLFGAELTYAMRLERQGIWELRDLPCGLREEEAGQRRSAA